MSLWTKARTAEKVVFTFKILICKVKTYSPPKKLNQVTTNSSIYRNTHFLTPCSHWVLSVFANMKMFPPFWKTFYFHFLYCKQNWTCFPTFCISSWSAAWVFCHFQLSSLIFSYKFSFCCPMKSKKNLSRIMQGCPFHHSFSTSYWKS